MDVFEYVNSLTPELIKELVNELQNHDIKSFEELLCVREHLIIFHDYYLSSDEQDIEEKLLPEIIKFLLNYKDDISGINFALLKKILQSDLSFNKKPSLNVLTELMLLFDCKALDFNETYIEAINVLYWSYRYFIAFPLYNYFLVSDTEIAYHHDNSDLVYDKLSHYLELDKFIIPYLYYHELDPNLIKVFMRCFVDNYDVIEASFRINNLITSNDKFNIYCDYDYIFEYIMSFMDESKEDGSYK